jgi:transcriptional regulator with XRE-family HTH domain
VSFYENYVKLCAEHNETPSGGAVAIGLTNAAATGWKNGKKPSTLTLTQLADHFGCTIDDLTWDGKAFSANLVKIMAANRKSTEAFARDIHLPRETVIAWLNCQSVPKRSDKIAIAEKYGYDVQSLDGELFDKKIPAMPEHDGLDFGAVEQWVDIADKNELLELMALIADRLKEL